MANYMAIKELDINNGPGLRTSFWFSGCHFHCTNCHNKEAWDFESGKEITIDIVNNVVDSLKEVCGEKINLSILGGEPLHYKNIEKCASLISSVRSKYGSDRTIWLWTGFTLEELKEILKTYSSIDEDKLTMERYKTFKSLEYILEKVDVLIDGRFEEDLKVENEYRGSSNQKIIKIN